MCEFAKRGDNVRTRASHHFAHRSHSRLATGFGLIADIALGIVGALIGAWLLPQLGIHLGSGIVAAIIAATIGALVLLLILRLVYRGGRW